MNEFLKLSIKYKKSEESLEFFEAAETQQYFTQEYLFHYFSHSQ